jgi:hypothetical protein
MEKEPVTIAQMDESVRAAITQARDSVREDREFQSSLDDLARLWNESCYQVIMLYTGLSLMRLVRAENAHHILQMAQSIIPRDASSGICVFVDAKH